MSAPSSIGLSERECSLPLPSNDRLSSCLAWAQSRAKPLPVVRRMSRAGSRFRIDASPKQAPFRSAASRRHRQPDIDHLERWRLQASSLPVRLHQIGARALHRGATNSGPCERAPRLASWPSDIIAPAHEFRKLSIVSTRVPAPIASLATPFLESSSPAEVLWPARHSPIGPARSQLVAFRTPRACGQLNI